MAGSQTPLYPCNTIWGSVHYMILTQPLVRLTAAHYQSAASMISFAQVSTAQWSDTFLVGMFSFQLEYHLMSILFQQCDMTIWDKILQHSMPWLTCLFLFAPMWLYLAADKTNVCLLYNPHITIEVKLRDKVLCYICISIYNSLQVNVHDIECTWRYTAYVQYLVRWLAGLYKLTK